MNDSIYSKVIFTDISETYPTDADIECRFYMLDAVVPTDNDTIGLFKLGWTVPSQCVVSKSVNHCETDKDCESDKDFEERKLKFTANELPKDGEQFYQFCYLNANLGICGASTPFRLFRPHERDLIQMDNNRESDEEDFVVIRSQQAILQERLQQMVNSNGVLEYSKRSLEQQTNALSTEVTDLRKLKGELEARIKYMQIDAQGFKDCMKSSEEKYYQQCCQIEHLELELAELKKIRIDQDTHLEATQLELFELTEKFNSLDANNSARYEQLMQRNDELIMMTRQCSHQQSIINDVKSKMSLLETELELSRATNANLLSERRDLDLENRLLRNELEDIKAKCDALEGNKDLMLNEISDLEKIKLKTSVEHKVMMENMDEIRKKLDENESYQKLMSDERQDKETEMQEQLVEMKRRLAQAAEEYQKLYKQNAKLECRIERIKSKIAYIRLPEQVKANGKTYAISENSFERQVNPSGQSTISDSFVHPFVQTIQSTVLPTQPIQTIQSTALPVTAQSASILSSRSQDRPNAAKQFEEMIALHESKEAASTTLTSTTSVKSLMENSNRIADRMCCNGRSVTESTDNYESINIITLPCTMCDEKVLCTERDLKPMTNHLEEKHSQRLCPICSMLFDFNMSGADNYFQMHVENHFDVVTNYQQPSAPNYLN